MPAGFRDFGLGRLFYFSPIPTWVYDPATAEFLEVNPAAVRQYGYSRDEFLRKTLYDIRPPEDRAALASKLQEMRTVPPEAFSLSSGWRHLRKDGSTVWVDISSLQFEWQGRTLRLGKAFDVTAHRELTNHLHEARDAALFASRVKTDFLRNISHELRTPMYVVLGMIDILLSSRLDEDQRSAAEAAQQAATSLRTAIDAILDFSELGTEHIRLQTKAFELPKLIDRVAQNFSHQAAAKGLGFEIVIAPAARRSVMVDDLHVGEVLSNLVANALKFTHRGSIVVALSLEHRAVGEAVLEFEVRDTGIGMTSDVQSRLFQPFMQADTSLTRKHRGAGMGLAISKKIIELMGGQIGGESQEGRGSRFWFTVPVRLEAG